MKSFLLYVTLIGAGHAERRRIMRVNHFTGCIVVLLVALSMSSCTKDEGKLPPPACNTPAVVSYSNNVNTLFQTYCSISGCHSGSSPAGNLNLDAASSYTALMKPGSGYIDTIHPEYSLLYSQMISVSTPMPPTGRLDNCKAEMILEWIQQKARNN